VLSPLFDDMLHLLTPGNRPPATPPAEKGAATTDQGVTSSKLGRENSQRYS
ncbi:Brefeldin A-inhibited guanine nucleotide-exchange protein 1, partial [Perkinsus olseni]